MDGSIVLRILYRIWSEKQFSGQKLFVMIRISGSASSFEHRYRALIELLEILQTSALQQTLPGFLQLLCLIFRQRIRT